ncbi:protein DOWNY MILDEW RESISTANCE 6-like isoform X2 [Canna indica]|uniref:Protein DOWNY MILDEW RESISTANCE 6-like isoform X2 n=1 Tax=Canna indica TaxID=4628 RepID=A0AAQ3Q5Z8_9LILI|nr:protein DOWNY MILDEW RESISTANCE 6-like isoform X2 [Canna indica]
MAEQLLSTVAHYSSLPQSYVRLPAQRPRLEEVIRDADIPTVDLGSSDNTQIVAQVADACRSYGFFQVVNHGVEMEIMKSMMEVASEFFRLPPEEKAKHYSEDPAKKMRLSTSFNIRKEKFRNWRDYLRLHCYPLEDFVPGWPSKPSSFKEVVSTYCREVRELGFRLLGIISLGLGVEEEYMVRVLGEQEQHMAVNYYPKCPEPDLTYGLQAHTDPNALTILLQDPNVAGLQVLKDGKWIAVNPQPDAFVINIGDQLQVYPFYVSCLPQLIIDIEGKAKEELMRVQMQALSNGRYRSVWHRAVVNSDEERISVASFLCPCSSVVISPPEKLVGDGSPAMYRSYTYDEYYKKFWSRNLDDDHCLELFKT